MMRMFTVVTHVTKIFEKFGGLCRKPAKPGSTTPRCSTPRPNWARPAAAWLGSTRRARPLARRGRRPDPVATLMRTCGSICAMHTTHAFNATAAMRAERMRMMSAAR